MSSSEADKSNRPRPNDGTVLVTGSFAVADGEQENVDSGHGITPVRSMREQDLDEWTAVMHRRRDHRMGVTAPPALSMFWSITQTTQRMPVYSPLAIHCRCIRWF